MQDIYKLVEHEFSSVNSLILEQLHSRISLIEDISEYLISSGGKRVRPLVTLLIAGAFNDIENPKQIKLATAIEFLHTATLLHDDVVDMSSLRRGKPTANFTWGNAASVLVGDFLYSRAFQLLVALQSLDVMHVLSDTTVRISEGEVNQLTQIGNIALDEQTYYQVIEDKTAQLFAGACHSAGLLASGSKETGENCSNFGLHIGLAFQLVDDYLDYAGDSESLGKNIGDDLAEGKLTLPLIEALRRTKNDNPDQHNTLQDIIKEKNLERIEELNEIVHYSGALMHTIEHARTQSEKAKAIAANFPKNSYTEALISLSDFVVERIR